MAYYTQDFKRKMVDLYNSGKSVININDDYRVSVTALYKWIKQLTPNNIKVTEDIKPENYYDLKKRIKDLESYIKKLENDKEILKKTVVVLANNN